MNSTQTPRADLPPAGPGLMLTSQLWQTMSLAWLKLVFKYSRHRRIGVLGSRIPRELGRTGIMT